MKARFFWLIPAFLGFVGSCKTTPGPESEPTFFTGTGWRFWKTPTGHEEITYFALIKTEAYIRVHHHRENFFGRVPPRDAQGKNVENPVLLGNYTTDFPLPLVGKKKAKAETVYERFAEELIQFYEKKMAAELDYEINLLMKVYEEEHGPGSLSEWHNYPWLQAQHFLRNFRFDAQQADQKKWKRIPLEFDGACNAARDNILRATKQAFAVWESHGKSVDPLDSQTPLWLGHVVHTIQDSYSPAHTKRNKQSGVIEEICVYGKKKEFVDGALDWEGMCRHPDLSVADILFPERSGRTDGVWDPLKGKDKECWASETKFRDSVCLRDTARKAMEATREYLLKVAELMIRIAEDSPADTELTQDSDETLVERMVNQFNDRYMVCQLSDYDGPSD